MAVMTRRERDKLIRKDDILKAAMLLFATKGYHDTSMSDIAKGSEYAVGTLYLYFKNKESIYLALFENKMEELLKSVRDAADKAKTAEEKIRVLVETHLFYFLKNIEFFQILSSERSNIFKMAEKVFAKKHIDTVMHYSKYVEEIIKEAEKDNYIAKNLPANKIAYIILGMIRSVCFIYLSGKKDEYIDHQGEADLILRIFLEGVRAKR